MMLKLGGDIVQALQLSGPGGGTARTGGLQTIVMLERKPRVVSVVRPRAAGSGQESEADLRPRRVRVKLRYPEGGENAGDGESGYDERESPVLACLPHEASAQLKQTSGQRDGNQARARLAPLASCRQRPAPSNVRFCARP